MGGFRLNKWQRLVLVIGASVSFLWSYGIWQDDPSDGRPGTAFLAGIVLALMALTPPPAGEEALPFVRQVLNHKRLVAGILVLAVLLLVVGRFASSQKAIESAAPDNVEMPAEEAMGTPVTALPTLPPTLEPDAIAKIEIPKQAERNKLPRIVGDCVHTSIKEISSRLQGVPESGSAVEYENGIYGVDYEMISSVSESRTGDPIRLCLISVPKNCPAGDDRGKVYSATNIRTQGSWSLADASHQCGGA